MRHGNTERQLKFNLASLAAGRRKETLGTNVHFDGLHCSKVIGGQSPVWAYSVEKLPNWEFENFHQKHIFAETL
jgi:hypothetical protein